MATWKLQDAKARLSEVIASAKNDGPQSITQRGTETAVVVSIEEWRAAKPKEDIIDVLLSGPKFDLDIPPRSRYRARKPVDF